MWWCVAVPSSRAACAAQFTRLSLCVQVPATPAQTKEQYKQDLDVWPCSFVFHEPPPVMSAAEEAVAAAHCDAVAAAAAEAGRSGWPPRAARVVDPVTNTVVAQAHDHTAGAGEGAVHPLHTPVMLCVEAVAQAHRVLEGKPGYCHATAPYLCTGLDLYTHTELDAMCVSHWV